MLRESTNVDPNSEVGSVIELAGLSSYVSGSSHSKIALFLLSDVFGFEAPNLRKLADKVVASVYYVVVFYFLNEDLFDLNNAEKPFPEWIKSHSPDHVVEDIKSVIVALRNQRITAVKAAGFCFSAKVVVQLIKSDDIQAVVLLHPSLCTIDDIKELKTPIAILEVEIDRTSPPAFLNQFEEILSSKPEVDVFVTVRYNVEDEDTAKAAK